MEKTEYTENVILVDADFLDHVTFDLIVNFERMIDRRIDAGDLCHWLDCIALDGGLRPGDNHVEVYFVHDGAHATLANFQPDDMEKDINGKAFQTEHGEFVMAACPTMDKISTAAILRELTQSALQKDGVQRIVVVAEPDTAADDLRQLCRDAHGKDVTLITMEETGGRGFGWENLGFSVMAALHIRADELR